MADQIGQALQHIRTILTGDAALVARVPVANIYMSFPNTEIPKIPMPCIILENEGGPAGFAAPIQQLSLRIHVWSRKSQPECYEIYEIARKLVDMSRLHSDVESNGTKVNQTSGYMRQVNRPSGGYAEEVQSYFCNGRFNIYTATNE